jgi:molybdate transport system substrate-binding protein
MKRVAIILLSLVLALSACAAPFPVLIPATTPVVTGEPSAIPTIDLNIFAAASLTGAFGEIGKHFEKAHPGVAVQINFGGSQTLRTQIEQGAQADVFASANQKEMDALVTENFVKADGFTVFLTNQLIIIMPASNPAGLKTLSDLSKPGVKLVLAAKEVPVGNYTLQVLDKLDTALGAGYKDKVLANVVSYENDVKQVVAKVQLGEADAGIVYLSDAFAAPELPWIGIPAGNNVIAKYPIAALSASPNADLAQAFIAYVLSREGQFILRKWGFLPVK